MPRLADVELAGSRSPPYSAGEEGEHCAVVVDACSESGELVLSPGVRQLWLEAAVEAAARDGDLAAVDGTAVVGVDNDGGAAEAGTGVEAEAVAGAAPVSKALMRNDDGCKAEWPQAKAAIDIPAAGRTGPDSRETAVLEVAAAVVAATECRTSAASDLC